MESPSRADDYLREGIQLVLSGHTGEAVELFQRGANLRPGNSILQFNLALSLQQTQRPEEAIRAYQEAVRVSPEFFDAWVNLASAYLGLGRVDAAIQAGQRAAALRPINANIHRLLASALGARKDLAGAKLAFHKAQEIEGDPFYKHIETSAKARRKGNLPEAWHHAQAALRIHPRHPEAHFNFGCLRLKQQQIQDAILSFYRALEGEPRRPDIWTELGHALMHLNAVQEAASAYRQAIECDAAYLTARYGLALAKLTAGNWEEAWPDFETRWNTGGPRYIQVPVWQGEEFRGKTLVLYGEQGLGDTIMFARYAPLVAERGGTILIECRPALRRLLEAIPGVGGVFAFGDPPPVLGLQCSFFSLPRIFQTSLQTIPGQKPYLTAPADIGLQMPSSTNSFPKVGLVWGSSNMAQWGFSKSIPLSVLQPVWSIPEIEFYSLQVGQHALQLEQDSGAAQRIIPLTSQLTDLAATAAAIQSLDLVISTDTSVAHLAGALGKPVWVLLPFVCDWRWLLVRADTPWYPSMQLFRQTKRHDWSEAALRVRDALRQRFPSNPKIESSA